MRLRKLGASSTHYWVHIQTTFFWNVLLNHGQALLFGKNTMRWYLTWTLTEKKTYHYKKKSINLPLNIIPVACLVIILKKNTPIKMWNWIGIQIIWIILQFKKCSFKESYSMLQYIMIREQNHRCTMQLCVLYYHKNKLNLFGLIFGIQTRSAPRRSEVNWTSALWPKHWQLSMKFSDGKSENPRNPYN